MKVGFLFRALCAPIVALIASTVFAAANVKVTNAWARATAPGQTTAAAYAEVTSDVDAVLVGASSAAAARVELHSMSMDNGVMRMRAAPRVELPAGKAVKLSPNGIHLMLIDVRKPLKAGDKVPLVLTIEARAASPQTVRAEAEVRPLGEPHGHTH